MAAMLNLAVLQIKCFCVNIKLQKNYKAKKFKTDLLKLIVI